MGTVVEAAAFDTVDGLVGEVMRLHRSLPARPAVEEVEAAEALALAADREERARLDAVERLRRPPGVPDELFYITQEMHRALAGFQCREQKRDAARLLELEAIHALFGDLIQRASQCLPSTSTRAAPRITSSTPAGATTSTATAAASSSSSSSAMDGVSSSVNGFAASRAVGTSTGRVSMDDSYVRKAKAAMWDGGAVATNPHLPRGAIEANSVAVRADGSYGDDKEKLSLIKLASMIEVAAKKGARDLNFQGRLMGQIEWLPDSIGKLTGLVTLDISENRLLALPEAIGKLLSLTKLDLHANRITQLPESIGDLRSLVYLNMRGNQLASLPSSLGRLLNLEELDVGANGLSSLPDSIGSLARLKRLIVETNNLDELPYTIGHCVSLVELQAGYNHLKALPEAVGKLESLEVLSVRYNNLRSLPTTMASLTKLKEVDVSFNELESIPENFCFVTSLIKLNVGNNFADLQYLPRSIGNLEMLEELDMSNNQIRVLPDSFGNLKHLRVLRAEENPLQMPPREIALKGAQAVVEYMSDAANKTTKSEPIKAKKTWVQFCFFSRPNKRKHDRIDNGR
ncbi:plant intracellular Ras-group-related LRR protein 4 [Oryza brachyantha]|uniref:Disease resistance R13L4/SHOC-2-like LRR domain-containing protein n=1 Tax=Oryza brachyantha TaxID=4533 RepID=J3MUC1_ORYBR|nr:plant intracellular Ras-group-related LRR protein 4 [Oryza brachyantha]